MASKLAVLVSMTGFYSTALAAQAIAPSFDIRCEGAVVHTENTKLSFFPQTVSYRVVTRENRVYRINKDGGVLDVCLPAKCAVSLSDREIRVKTFVGATATNLFIDRVVGSGYDLQQMRPSPDLEIAFNHTLTCSRTAGDAPRGSRL